MSYADALDSITTRIEALTPAWDADRRFRCIETGAHGAPGAPLEEIASDVDRLFDVRLASLPADDGSAGFVWTRWVVGLELRVRYAATADRARLERAMAFDASQLASALVHPSLPTPWHTSIDTVEPPDAPTLEPIAGPEGKPLAWLMSMSFTLHYSYTPEIGA
ncbi:MAG: hypothetical protein KC583_17755 [Myxococcales bacterium]|nr:hypothetical protein [Myxococcales bacterium]